MSAEEVIFCAKIGKNMRVLGIETSCDETSISLIDFSGSDSSNRSFKVLSHIIHSQIELHKQYGGVFPMMAKREHAKNLMPIYKSVSESIKNIRDGGEIKSIKISPEIKTKLGGILEREPELLESIVADEIPNPGIDLITVTEGPGLEPALWVGINFARALSTALNVPVLPVNHMEGHIIGSFIGADKINVSENIGIKNMDFPALALLISGGHTEIVTINKIGDYKIIGATRDDSIGEAFDKVARLLNLPYPGGPEISKLAEYARENKLASENIVLPRPMINSNDLDFSFSGIKTAVLYLVKDLEKKSINLDEKIKAIIACEFENAVTEVVLAKIDKAVNETSVKDLIIGGGVSANIHIKKELSDYANKNGLNIHLPLRDVSGDNALMIAIAGAIKYSINPITKDATNLVARGNLSLES
jgi:N6-L-threonylcarbamoyladenine synthase